MADSEEAIARCSRIASAGDRILCLENALREKSGEITAEPVLESADSPVDAADDIGIAEEAVPAREEIVGPPASTPSESPADTVAGAAAANADVVTEQSAQEYEIGAEQVRARNMTQEQRESALETVTGLRVATYDEVPYQRLVVRLENGQVWRQIKGDIQRIRVSLERNQTVNITESRLGGYQLRLNEIRRTIRVERLK